MEVAAGLVFRDGQLLITQRSSHAHLAGFWEFPGGKREANESFVECLHRELREELGIEVEVGTLLESITHPYDKKTVYIEFFRCQWLKHEPQPLGCPAFRWIKQSDLTSFSFPPADARLLSRLRQNPELWLPPG